MIFPLQYRLDSCFCLHVRPNTCCARRPPYGMLILIVSQPFSVASFPEERFSKCDISLGNSWILSLWTLSWRASPRLQRRLGPIRVPLRDCTWWTTVVPRQRKLGCNHKFCVADEHHLGCQLPHLDQAKLCSVLRHLKSKPLYRQRRRYGAVHLQPLSSSIPR